MTLNARKALIDNSTLSATERILAISSAKNLWNIDHDIACYEKLINAILFYDELFLIDDYIPYYRNRRKDTFSFISAVKINEDDYGSAAQEAAEFAADQPFEMKNGEPSGDTPRFFENLLLKPQMRWDVFVSSEYLTLTYLVDGETEKFLVGPTIAACANEGTDAAKTSKTSRPETLILDHSDGADLAARGENVAAFISRLQRGNKNNTGSGSRDTLAKVVFAYGWIAERTRFYEIVSRRLGFSPILSPLRDAYSLSSVGMRPFSLADNFLRSMSDISVRTLRDAAALTDCTSLQFKLPFFSAWLLSKTENAREALQLALEIRNRAEFKDARDQLANLTLLSPIDQKGEVAKLAKTIAYNNDSILKKYTVSSANGPSLSFSVGLGGPSVGVSANAGSLFRGLRGGPIARTYRSLATDLLAVERLGAIHEKMTRLVRDQDAGYALLSTTPSYMRKRSSDYGYPAD